VQFAAAAADVKNCAAAANRAFQLISISVAQQKEYRTIETKIAAAAADVKNCAAAANRAFQLVSKNNFLPQRRKEHRGKAHKLACFPSFSDRQKAVPTIDYPVVKVHDFRVAWFREFRLNTRLK
jgi:hypothetical protein